VWRVRAGDGGFESHTASIAGRRGADNPLHTAKKENGRRVRRVGT
jgi:hypothetical protein